MRARTELPWRFLGRHVQPLALAISIATWVDAWFLLIEGDVAGTTLDGTRAGVTIGFVNLATAILLNTGWWARNQWAINWGLLLAAGAFTARGVVLLTDPDIPLHSAMFTFAWVIAAGGSHLLEVADHRRFPLKVGPGRADE